VAPTDAVPTPSRWRCADDLRFNTARLSIRHSNHDALLRAGQVVVAVAARILVVDDHEVVLQFTSYVLRHSGHTVLLARGGREGLAVATRELPDLILSDLRMGGMSGVELSRALAADSGLAGIPRIALTGDPSAATADFQGCIVKPIDRTTFVQEVEAFLPDGLRGVPAPRCGIPEATE
jgi:two-component system, cell cycle response regulator DivK